MVKARFHREFIKDGDIIELPDGISALTILYTPVPVKTVIAWLEEVDE